MKRSSYLLAVVVLSASLLSGCGGGTDAYCDDLKETKDAISGLDSADFTNFDELTDQIDEFADDAPDEVKDDWKVVADAFNEFLDALEDAGVKPEDLEAMTTTGQLPEGVDVEDLTAAMEKAEGISSAKVEKATDAIQKHAKDECNVDLDAG